MYAWETELYKLILEKRKEEVKAIKKIYDFLNFVRGFFDTSAVISSFIIFWSYTHFTGKTIYPEDGFATLIIC